MPRDDRGRARAAPSGPLRLALLACTVAAAGAAHALNNCSEFVDLRARRSVTINVASLQNRYSPSCLHVAVDTTVTFNADFSDHPLYGGVVAGGVATIDPASPVGAHNSGTAPVVIVLTTPGEFPYFCDFHYQDGMMGSILVDPAFFDDGFEADAVEAPDATP